VEEKNQKHLVRSRGVFLCKNNHKKEAEIKDILKAQHSLLAGTQRPAQGIILRVVFFTRISMIAAGNHVRISQRIVFFDEWF